VKTTEEKEQERREQDKKRALQYSQWIQAFFEKVDSKVCSLCFIFYSTIHSRFFTSHFRNKITTVAKIRWTSQLISWNRMGIATQRGIIDE
jgi:hypothetical protein